MSYILGVSQQHRHASSKIMPNQFRDRPLELIGRERLCRFITNNEPQKMKVCREAFEHGRQYGHLQGTVSGFSQGFNQGFERGTKLSHDSVFTRNNAG